MNNLSEPLATKTSLLMRQLSYFFSITILVLSSMTAYLWLPRVNTYFRSKDQDLILQTQQAVYGHEQQLTDLSQKVTKLLNDHAQDNLVSKKQLFNFENFLIFKLHILSGANYISQLKRFFDTYHIESDSYPTLVQYASSGTKELRVIDEIIKQECHQHQQSKWQAFKNWFKNLISHKSDPQILDQTTQNIVTLIQSEQYSSAMTLIQDAYPSYQKNFKTSLHLLNDAVHLQYELEQLRQFILNQH